MWSKNPRISNRDRSAIKGALRRAFSRSDLRKMALDRTRIKHVDPSRPRVKQWSRCQVCQTPTPTYQLQIDHISPVIPVEKHFDEMTLDESTERMWCELNNLQGICESCHDSKTKAEKEARKPHAKPRKPKRKK